ncbi:MAG: TM0106 family RecB-like putative nuclease [Planctomycetota bacterium]
MVDAPNPLSATRVAAHLACEHKTQLDRAIADGLLRVEVRDDPRLEAAIERGRRFEQDHVATLRAAGLRVTELPQGATPADTLAAMQRGDDAIVQAPLGDGRLRGIADVLQRVERGSQLGAWSYEPVDTKLARETKATTILQLLTYAELLGALQGVVPERVHVVTPAATERYRTADFGAFHRLLTARALDARTATPAPTTYPEPVPHCDVCSYWRHCEQRRRQDDHLSLVAGLGRAQARELLRQGVPTVAALAACEGQLPEPPQRGNAETFRRLGHQARLQVAARGAATVPYELLEPARDQHGAIAARGFARLPAPSPGDLFLDFEGDPFVGDGGLEYLTGWVDAAGSYQQRWAGDRRQEKAAIEALLDVVAAARQRDPQMHVYHFAAYEPAALKRTTQRHQTRVDLLDELLRAQVFVDLRAVTKEALRIGVDSYGLKQLEPVFDYERALPLQVAAKARQRLEIALELGDVEVVRDEAVRRLVAEYNRDDCVATLRLRDWLEARRGEAEVRFGGIPRPGVPKGLPSENSTKRHADVAARVAALREGLPDGDLAPRTPAHTRRLLADLLGYFLREEKCSWWEFFRLRELPREDQLEEREAIGGLTFSHTVSSPAGEQLYVYRFPEQETAIEDEELFLCSDEDPSPDKATKFGRAIAIDFDRKELTVEKEPGASHLHPSCVFRHTTYPLKHLEATLLGLADHVLANGLEDRSAWSAALDLLQARPPRLLDRGAPTPMRREGESFAEALTSRCLALDGSTLPVQGPPGTGKSHTGALAILALLRAGKTVGITAVSHKVILNLVTKVRDLAQEQGLDIPLFHTKQLDTLPRGVAFADTKSPPVPGGVLSGVAWTWASRARIDDAGKVDYLFVDEAGQMALPTVLAASRGARNLILLGDPMQLEQPRRGAHPDGADKAALVHLLDPGQQVLRPEQGIFLGTTWRMHPTLTAFPSELYYEGKLTARPACAQQRLDGTDGFDGAGLSFVPVEHLGNQARSDEEVAAIVALVKRLLRQGATFTDRDGAVRALVPDDLLVVAPYNAQVAALQRALRRLGVHRVGTVDRFQGQEAPVVLYSCTSSSADEAPRGMTFLFDPHRFNVATSRAMARVIVVASPALQTPECRTVEHLHMANGLCRFVELASAGMAMD